MTMIADPVSIPTPSIPEVSPAISAGQVNTKGKLMGYLNEGQLNLPILGWVCWWNVREVSLTREQFSGFLKTVGLDDKYARSHNYRSALIRALRSMEEGKLIRRVKEDGIYIVFQFTAEQLVQSGDGENPRLEYNAEVTVTVDKEAYAMFAKDENGFIKSISHVTNPNTGLEAQNADQIKVAISNAFDREKDTYKSSDVTRYIQQIFEDSADIISLRPQGSIYFVPAGFQSIVYSVKQLVEYIGGMCTFETFPVPDVKDARKTIGDSFAEEVAETLSKMDEEIKKANEGGKDITEKWVSTRQERIIKLKNRIDMYAEVLGDKARDFHSDFNALSDMLKPRVLAL